VNRTQFLIVSVVVLLVGAIVHHIWAGWGLVTIHAKEKPIGLVIASMERQGHAKIQTDIPGDTLVTMDVVKVPLTQALEVLSANSDSRWRLLFFVAGDKTTLKTAETSWFGGQRPDGWKMLSFPMPNIFLADDVVAVPLDPRDDVWNPKTSGPAAVQAYFSEAAQLTNAGFAFPETWNPQVNSTPPSGKVDRVIPKLISAAGGKADELFFLTKNVRRRGEFAGRGDGDFNPDLMAERMQAQIDRLPEDERADAQAAFDTQKAFRASLAGMTDDQRRAAFIQHMQDPQVQQQMMNRMDAAEANLNHENRMQRFQNFVTHKLQAMGKL
jgi:hypothetical protein